MHAVTDVTGYGLAGHSWEMAERSGLGRSSTPARSTLPGCAAVADAGQRTGGDPRNRDYLAGHLDSTAPAGAEALCFDPQTSGGLLAAVDAAVADDLAGHDGWWRVGEIVAGEPQLLLPLRETRRGDAARETAPMPQPASVGRRVRRRSARRPGRSSRSCGPAGTTSSSASTRSAADRGPGR